MKIIRESAFEHSVKAVEFSFREGKTPRRAIKTLLLAPSAQPRVSSFPKNGKR